MRAVRSFASLIQIAGRLGRRERVRVALKKCFRAPSKGGQAKRLKDLTLNRKDCLSFREIWTSSERVNLYKRQIMILPKKTQTYATQSCPGTLSESLDAGNLYRLSLCHRQCRTLTHLCSEKRSNLYCEGQETALFYRRKVLYL